MHVYVYVGQITLESAHRILPKLRRFPRQKTKYSTDRNFREISMISTSIRFLWQILQNARNKGLSLLWMLSFQIFSQISDIHDLH